MIKKRRGYRSVDFVARCNAGYGREIEVPVLSAVGIQTRCIGFESRSVDDGATGLHQYVNKSQVKLMEQDYWILLQQAKEKLDKSFFLVAASLEDLEPYDLAKNYTAKGLEPYDALSDRFIRCIETFIRYFKTYEY